MRNDRFRWQLPLYTALASVLVFTPLIMAGQDFDILYLLTAFFASLLLLVLAVVSLFRKKGLQSLTRLSMFVVLCVASFLLMKHGEAIRASCRWLLWSNRYKAEVMAQPAAPKGELKHLEWDGWGFAGSDTVVYLVFDPNDSIAPELKTHKSGKFRGIPCEVPKIQRLERHWYSVVFNTDFGWNDCPS
jgi:hypothetical protein